MKNQNLWSTSLSMGLLQGTCVIFDKKLFYTNRLNYEPQGIPEKGLQIACAVTMYSSVNGDCCYEEKLKGTSRERKEWWQQSLPILECFINYFSSTRLECESNSSAKSDIEEHLKCHERLRPRRHFRNRQLSGARLPVCDNTK